MKTISCRRVGLAYTEAERTTHALRDVTLELPGGHFYGIMGPSGSGKSSLLYLLSGLKRPTTGDVSYDGESISSASDRRRTELRRTRFGFVFQQPFLLTYLTARENVLVAAGGHGKAERTKADALLDALGLGGMGDKLPSQLSGGEKQRVAVARAMVSEPEVLFADEPTAALDHDNALRVIAALAQWRERGTVIVVTHDPEMLQGADWVVRLRSGSLVDDDANP